MDFEWSMNTHLRVMSNEDFLQWTRILRSLHFYCRHFCFRSLLLWETVHTGTFFVFCVIERIYMIFPRSQNVFSKPLLKIAPNKLTMKGKWNVANIKLVCKAGPGENKWSSISMEEYILQIMLLYYQWFIDFSKANRIYNFKNADDYIPNSSFHTLIAFPYLFSVQGHN